MKKTFLSLLTAFLLLTSTSSAIGDWDFSAPTSYGVGARPNSVAIGDFNSDGRQDLAVLNEYSNNVSILLGTGSGRFAPQTTFGVGRGPTAIAVGDFDGNGHQDLAVTIKHNPWGVSVLLGIGDGTFAPHTTYPVGGGLSAVAVGDFDEDGHQDIAVTRTSAVVANYVSVLLGNGDGSFAPPTDNWVGLLPRSFVIGDFDGDGHQDFAVVTPWELWVLLGNGDGSFAAATRYSVNWPSRAIAIGDFNGDGRQDLAVTSSRGLSILLGNPNGTFVPWTTTDGGARPDYIAIGDFNNDGRSDPAVTTDPFEEIRVLLGRGNGSFDLHPPIHIGVELTSIAVGDFDADGWQDIVVAKWDTNDVAVLLNRFIGQIDIIPFCFPNGINPRSLDFIPVALLGSEEFDVTDVDVDTLRFGPDEAAPVHDLTDSFIYNEHLRDLNHDGHVDLLTHYWNQDSGIQCGDTSASLTGRTKSGRLFAGSDSVWVMCVSPILDRPPLLEGFQPSSSRTDRGPFGSRTRE